MLFNALARFTAHLATPDKPTMTSFHPAHFLHLVATPTAQRLTALRAVRPPLTSSAPGPCHTAGRVRTTVVGRSVDVNELRVGDGLAALALLSPAQGRTQAGKDGRAAARVEGPGCGRPAWTGRYLDRVLVLGLELVADLAE